MPKLKGKRLAFKEQIELFAQTADKIADGDYSSSDDAGGPKIIAQ